MKPNTVGELLHWSYANLAMAHSAITANAENYGRTQFMIRARLYKGLNAGTMSIGVGFRMIMYPFEAGRYSVLGT